MSASRNGRPLAARIKRFFRRAEWKLCSRVLDRMDRRIDRRVCGQSLAEYVPSLFRDDKNGVGGTGSYSTPYLLLKQIFARVPLRPSDVFLDVGCGKGRVLAFLVKENCPCRLYGIEHNAEVGRIAADWAARCDRVQILIGDALQHDYDGYTVLSLGRPFLPKSFLRFVERLEATLRHPITLIYWYDRQSGALLRGRPGWELRLREPIARVHGLLVAPWPDSYSVWTYDPERREAEAERAASPG